MGTTTFGAPPDLVLALKDKFKIESFVETGTFRGSTTMWAANNFAKVTTIERSESVYNHVQSSLSAYNNIKSILGESSIELRRILSDLPRSIFWLDAHWCGEDTAGSDDECPLIPELHAIMPWFQKHVILIDDARLFVKPPPLPHAAEQWPSLDDIAQVVSSYGQSYTCIVGDIIVIVPAVYRHDVTNIIRRIYP